ncbi:MAG: hypothetical protein LBR43_03325 [Spiroplasmataceae bacterium]|jgi:predicted transcriptional regulator|nr:hypothetical protein [Spiroplasmataceae bacterium]
MKITNLIVPIVALTILSNDKVSAFKSEIENSNFSQLEIISEDGNLGDVDLVKIQNPFSFITTIDVKSIENEKIISHSASCDALYRSIMDTCNALTGAKKTACIATAYSTYLGCLGAGGDNL